MHRNDNNNPRTKKPKKKQYHSIHLLVKMQSQKLEDIFSTYYTNAFLKTTNFTKFSTETI